MNPQTSDDITAFTVDDGHRVIAHCSDGTRLEIGVGGALTVLLDGVKRLRRGVTEDYQIAYREIGRIFGVDPYWVQKFHEDHERMPDFRMLCSAARVYPWEGNNRADQPPPDAYADAIRQDECERLRAAGLLRTEKIDVVHKAPQGDSGITPCCRKPPFDLPLHDRLTNDDDVVTCVFYDKPRNPTTGLDFSQALAAMREGKRVRRVGWPDYIKRERRNGITLERGLILTKDEHSDTSVLLCGADLLSSDWEIVE